MRNGEQFFAELARAVIMAGNGRYDSEQALTLAQEAWAELRRIGEDSYPCMVEYPETLRFVYQWDEVPPMVIVMFWNDRMWQDVARVQVPAELPDHSG